jgi:rod shape determining protein RodA
MQLGSDKGDTSRVRLAFIKSDRPAGRDLDDAGTTPWSYTVLLSILLVVLLTAGAFNLYSASNGSALFYTQLKLIPVGLLLFVVTGFWLKPKQLNTNAYWIFAATCALLAIVLLGGEIGGGSRRWLEVGGFRAQPSELAKITIAIVTARFIATMGLEMSYNLKDLVPIVALVAIAAGLIFPQPDLGTATLLVLIATCQLCFIHIRWRSIASIGAIAAIGAPLIWQFGLMDYQKYRVLTFLNPGLDPQGKGYNSFQSLVAIGNGGTYGTGFMNGTQTHLKFLPKSHSDFIFSVFAEEHGFAGSVLLFLAFTAIAYCALEIARRSKNTFNMLLAVGLGAFVFLEFSINVAMVLRLLPVKGLPLPFMSHGGSNLLTSCLVMGLLVAIDRENRMRTKSSRHEVFKN